MSKTAFTIHSSAPDAAVVFYPYQIEDDYTTKKGDERALEKQFPGVISKTKTSFSTSFMEVNEIRVQKDILSVTTTKGKTGVGTFSIALTSNVNWKSKLAPGTWCCIYISDRAIDLNDGSSPSSGLKMVGIVRSVQRQEVVSEGFRYVRYQISGEDFQSVFNSSIYLNTNLEGTGKPIAISIGLGISARKKQNLQSSADFIVTNILENTLGPMHRVVKDNTRVQDVSSKIIVGGATKPILVPSPVARRLLGDSHTGKTFTGMVTFFLQDNTLGETIAIPDIGGVTPIWGLLNAFSNRLLNEIYTDLLPVFIDNEVRLVPSFVLRAIPFNESQIDKSCIRFLSAADVVSRATVDPSKDISVPVKSGQASNFYISKKIDESEIMGLRSGKSDAERFNFFLVVPNVIAGAASAEGSIVAEAVRSSDGINSLVNSESLQRHGLRPYIAYSQYFLNAPLTIMNDISEDLWYRAHLYENGQVTLHGSREHIPVGTNIKFTERGWLAHVEKVDHQFQISGDGNKAIKNYRTTISFSRLQTTEGDPIDLIEASPPIKDGTDDTGMGGSWDRGVDKVNT